MFAFMSQRLRTSEQKQRHSQRTNDEGNYKLNGSKASDVEHDKLTKGFEQLSGIVFVVKLANYTRQGVLTFSVNGFQLHCELSIYCAGNHVEAKL